jgi:hypothetical protein
LRRRKDCVSGGVGAVIAVMVAFVQGLWRWQRQRSDCGSGVDAVIVASALVGAVIVAAALVGTVIVAAALVVAVIVAAALVVAVIVAAALVVAVIVVAALAQRLRGRWRSACSGSSVCAAITAAAALVQRLQQQWHWFEILISLQVSIAIITSQNTSSGNHYSGEDFTSKLKSVNQLLFYLTTLIRDHVYSSCFPVKHMDSRENLLFRL